MLVPDKQTTEIFTWQKLKDFCNSLTDEQLQQEVIVPQDESNITIAFASSLGEDKYYFDDYEYCTTKDDFDCEIFGEEKITFEEALKLYDYAIIPGTNVYLFELE